MAASAAKRGAFIVFEGLDRCGKTTQAQRLVQYLNDRQEHAVFMRFPDRTTQIGKMIDAYLARNEELDDRAVHLLFAANRWEQHKVIENTLCQGTHVVCDRYSFSGVAFSSSKGLDLDWCYQPERGLPSPDVVIFIELSLDEAEKRGSYGEERYEKREMQQRVEEVFRTLRTDSWRIVDGARSIEDVEAEVRRVADQVVGNTGADPIQVLR